MSLNSAQSIFNLIRTYASDKYKDVVPPLTDKSPIGDVSTPILSQPAVFKEFSTLLGAFIKDYVEEQLWENPLIELFTNTVRPLGEWSREIGANPVTPRKYDITHPERVLQYAESNDKVLYYVRNVREYFKLSIPLEDMEGAFHSYDDFNSYVSMKISSQLSGKEISMFNHIKEAINANLNAGALVTEATVGASDLNEAAIKAFTKSVKSLSKKFRFPSTEYNKYAQLEGATEPFKTWTKPDDVVIIATIDYMTAVDVDYLAAAFNLDKAEIRDRIYEIDDFGFDTYDDDGVFLSHTDSPIQAIICDRRFFRFSRDLDMNTERFNEETLVMNYWSHAWYTYGINVMANNTVYIIPDDFDVPSVNPSSIQVSGIGSGNKKVAFNTTNFDVISNVTVSDILYKGTDYTGGLSIDGTDLLTALELNDAGTEITVKGMTLKGLVGSALAGIDESYTIKTDDVLTFTIGYIWGEDDSVLPVDFYISFA